MSIVNNLSFFKQQNISISGSWGDGPHRDWKGIAISTEPLVSLNILKIENNYEWCKSERGNSDGQPIRLLISPYAINSPDVQVGFSVGGGHVRNGCILPTTNYRPELLVNNGAATGRIERMFFIEGSKMIELFCLFLVASDVKIGRNGLWHIHDKFRNKLSEPLDKILTYGKTGHFKIT